MKKGQGGMPFFDRRTKKDRRLNKKGKSNKGTDRRSGKDRRAGKDRRSNTNPKTEAERRRLTDDIIAYLEEELNK